MLTSKNLRIMQYCKFSLTEKLCCNFHLGKNWLRNIQQHKILSSEYLNNDSEIGKCEMDEMFYWD